MTGKEFFNSIANSQEDVLEQFLEILHKMQIEYCVVGGLAVNAYAEPVVSLDLVVVVVAGELDKLLKEAKTIFNVSQFPHTLNLNSEKSDLRIQIQADPRYQPFITRASMREVIGYRMKVASKEDVLQGKIWAYSDEERRKSKRQKDLADIFRLVEAYPELNEMLPDFIKNKEG